jgi:hypothetical protein
LGEQAQGGQGAEQRNDLQAGLLGDEGGQDSSSPALVAAPVRSGTQAPETYRLACDKLTPALGGWLRRLQRVNRGLTGTTSLARTDPPAGPTGRLPDTLCGCLCCLRPWAWMGFENLPADCYAGIRRPPAARAWNAGPCRDQGCLGCPKPNFPKPRLEGPGSLGTIGSWRALFGKNTGILPLSQGRTDGYAAIPRELTSVQERV